MLQDLVKLAASLRQLDAYGTPMPQSGRRPQHQKQKSRPALPVSGPPLKADAEVAVSDVC